MTLIAKHLSVSIPTVIHELIKTGESLYSKYNYLPEHIGIDEFKSVKAVSGAISVILLIISSMK